MRMLGAVGAALAVMLVAVAVVVTAGGDGAGEGPGAGAGGGPGDDLVLAAAALQPFDDCQDLLRYYQDHALEQVGPYGLDGGFAVQEDMAQESADAPVAAPAPAGGDARAVAPESAEAGSAEGAAGFAPADGALDAVGPGETGTNVQEAGVDEPDIVKTDGDLVVSVAGNELRVVDLTGEQPTLAGTLDLPEGWQHELLLDGDRVLVVSRGAADLLPQPGIERERAYLPVFSETTVLTAVDVSDPADPRQESSLTLDGSYRSARAVDGTARIVVSASPVALPFVTPEGGGLRAEQEALEENRRIIESSTLDDWLPWSVRTGADGEVLEEGPALACEALRRPPEFSGLSTLAVLTVDLSGDLDAEGTAGVVANGETVYASAERLYVATTEWNQEPDTRTDIHAFDISDPATATYLASGGVDGRLLNSYALSAYEGHLRVAATTDASGPQGESESAVVVLAEEGDRLVEVGRVGGLGRTEQIRAVRFLGDLATVVTFRQTDPLYTLDLSDPTAPELLGELKIPGFSAYLHPVGEERLLGIGQDADDQGRILGAQASLFDLSDLRDPSRVDQLDLGEGTAEVEVDPRAFLYWPDSALAVVPFQRYSVEPIPLPEPLPEVPPVDPDVPFPGVPESPPVDPRSGGGVQPVPLPVEPDGGPGGPTREFAPQQTFAGAVAIRVDGDQLVEVGRVEHDAGPDGFAAPIRRALVVDGALITVSDDALAVSDLTTLERRALLPLD